MSKHAEFADQDPKAVLWYRRAFQTGTQAVTLYDLGIARGLLLALKRDGVINLSTLDKMFKRILDATPKRLVRRVPKSDRANLGKKRSAPASKSTRRKRKSRPAV